MSADWLSTAYAMHEDHGPDSLAAQLQQLMADRRLWAYHSATPIRDRSGWPDQAIIGRPAGPPCDQCGRRPLGMLFRELKSEHGTLTPAQRGVGALLMNAGQDWAVWRPRDLFNGVIARQLDGIT